MKEKKQDLLWNLRNIIYLRNKRQLLEKYAFQLWQNQNMTNTPCLQDIYSINDYNVLLQEVLNILKKNSSMNLSGIRFELFKRSGLKEAMEIFVSYTKTTPGILLDFGTFKTRETILCGLSQEYTFQNGEIVYVPRAMEEDTIFDLASTSKLFTCISILKLEELGLIDLYDPVSKYVPEFQKIGTTSIIDLLKFKVMIVTDKRIDEAKTAEEALLILFTAHPKEEQEAINAYTDIGAMVLRLVVESVAKMPFSLFVEEMILRPTGMNDTYLNVPPEKLSRVANENFSSIVSGDGSIKTKYDNIPGTPHDDKARVMGHSSGIAPGHAGYFSTKDDMIKLGNALIRGEILTKESVLSIANNHTGYFDQDFYSYFYGSLVYTKQPNEKNIYIPLSGKMFFSPGFAGTTLVVDPINEITFFMGANRLHNRIYQVHPNYQSLIRTKSHNQKTYTLPDGEEKVVSANFYREREVILKLALDLSLQYQFLEQLFPSDKEMHLVRELNKEKY